MQTLCKQHLGVFVKTVVTWSEYSQRAMMIANLLGVIKKPSKLINDNKVMEIKLFN